MKTCRELVRHLVLFFLIWQQAEEMTGAVEMGQLLIALQHQENITDAGPSRLLKILIGRAEGLSSTKSVVNKLNSRAVRFVTQK